MDDNAAAQGRWISGAEVMRIYKLHPKELGELCLQGKLTPYHDGSLEPVREGDYFHNRRFYFTFPEFYKKNKPEMPPRGPDPNSFPVWQNLLAALLFRREEISEAFPLPAGQQDQQAPEADPPVLTNKGGSLPDTEKIRATQAACEWVAQAMLGADANSSFREGDGKIGLKFFQDKVHESMVSTEEGPLFQLSAAEQYYKSRNDLNPIKRTRGRIPQRPHS
jgi:hypothetical protein